MTKVFGQWIVPLSLAEIQTQLTQTEAAIELLPGSCAKEYLVKIRNGLAAEIASRQTITVTPSWR
jgi:hypothetical protein